MYVKLHCPQFDKFEIRNEVDLSKSVFMKLELTDKYLCTWKKFKLELKKNIFLDCQTRGTNASTKCRRYRSSQ